MPNTPDIEGKARLLLHNKEAATLRGRLLFYPSEALFQTNITTICDKKVLSAPINGDCTAIPESLPLRRKLVMLEINRHKR